MRSLLVGLPRLALAAAPPAPADLDWPRVQLDGREPRCTEALPEGTQTLLGIRLEQGSLDAFERVLGASALHKEGDAGDYFEWRCWEAANADGTVLVVGRGEVDAQLRVLGRGMKFAARGSCPKSRKVSRALATANGVRLGLTRADIEQKTGRATATGVGWFDRACLSKKAMTEDERVAQRAGPEGAWDVSSQLTVVEAQGRVEGFRVIWAVSY